MLTGFLVVVKLPAKFLERFWSFLGFFNSGGEIVRASVESAWRNREGDFHDRAGLGC